MHPLATQQESDDLYRRNDVYFAEDKKTYEARTHKQKYGFLKLLSRR